MSIYYDHACKNLVSFPILPLSPIAVKPARDAGIMQDLILGSCSAHRRKRPQNPSGHRARAFMEQRKPSPEAKNLKKAIDKCNPLAYNIKVACEKRRNLRGVAQSGSAPALGAGCRGFKSLHPDHFRPAKGVRCGPVVKWPKTPPFHGGNSGSNPGRVILFSSIRRSGFAGKP